jgi:hypothetical protein
MQQQDKNSRVILEAVNSALFSCGLIDAETRHRCVVCEPGKLAELPLVLAIRLEGVLDD